MHQVWRWFGPADPVGLGEARQAGAQGIVTALHDLPPGAVWSGDAICDRQRQIAEGSHGALAWSVVESLPVSEAIKTQGPAMHAHLDAYRASLRALAEAGLRVVCYNFMPVLDWTRTDLHAPMAHGGTAMRFDLTRFAVFDIFLLRRPGAAEAYDEPVREAAGALFATMSDVAKSDLVASVIAGLPGSADSWTLDTLAGALKRYADIDADRLAQTHIDFLAEMVPTAERLGLRLCCHPDDPPFPLLGLPRIMSTGKGFRRVLDAVDSPAAGVTLCTGSLGARPDNDCVAIARDLAPKIHFAHLRNVTRDSETVPCSFHEDEHLAGQTDVVGVVRVLLDEERRRQAEGRADAEIPMRPDHGQDILSDIGAGAAPGYPAVGRLKGLAELRGVMAGLDRAVP